MQQPNPVRDSGSFLNQKTNSTKAIIEISKKQPLGKTGVCIKLKFPETEE